MSGYTDTRVVSSEEFGYFKPLCKSASPYLGRSPIVFLDCGERLLYRTKSSRSSSFFQNQAVADFSNRIPLLQVITTVCIRTATLDR